MRRLHQHSLRAFVSLVLSISITSLLWNYPYPRPSNGFFTELRGHTSVDFAVCPSTEQKVGVQYGYVVYRLDRALPGVCRMRLASVIEMFHWDGRFTSTCLVPQSVGKQTFSIRGFGIEMPSIKAYCFDHITMMWLSGITLTLSIVLFLILSAIRWYGQRRKVRTQSNA